MKISKLAGISIALLIVGKLYLNHSNKVRNEEYDRQLQIQNGVIEAPKSTSEKESKSVLEGVMVPPKESFPKPIDVCLSASKKIGWDKECEKLVNELNECLSSANQKDKKVLECNLQFTNKTNLVVNK